MAIVPRYEKPFLALPQQIDLLVERGMTITDRVKAEQCLARIGYYRLSAYWHPFRCSESGVDPATGAALFKLLDRFHLETSFTTVHDLYVFDKTLRLLALDALERIEIAVRTDISLLLGQRDPWAHRNPRLLHGTFARRPEAGGRTRHDDWLERLDRKFAESREDFAKHFRRMYPDDHPPIWITVELWDFGALSHFYAGMTVADRDALARAYGIPSGNILMTWLRCLNDIRNICAHHSRMWNRPLSSRVSWPQQGEIPLLDHIVTSEVDWTRTRLYSALAILALLVRRINPTSSWTTRVADHVRRIPVSPHLTLASAGFPKTWRAEALWSPPA